MQGGFLLETVLPFSLFIIMFGMGLSLTGKDFARVALYPKAVMIGLLAQLILLPIFGFCVAVTFRMEPLLAVGLMVLSCCPSGPTSNMYSYLFHGDVALSVTLTALISIIKPFTLPFLAYYSMVYFMGEGKAINLPIFKTILQLFTITVLPVGLGMSFKRWIPKFAASFEKPIKYFSMIILFLIIAGLVKQNWGKMIGFFAVTGAAALTMNCLCISVGFLLGILLRLSRPQAITIAFELGIQNGTTALLVTGTILMVPTMTIVPITYSLLMFLTALIFGLFMVKRNRNARAADLSETVS
ncbi:sodium Bile acid symporter family protein [Leptospira fainei serovar Hurstbridge str. BUT 6]|uniref:Sodium Bile acid symporter family protein n=1 Tax=Leptospira fainei serovar Hurstbridge str. BUT 6 TaxID=1193011 RepID=S3V0U2_9LEPT|nr:bile acid:sodium symporter family protein [Leptospira fainei]EPG76306.1 sodium Bile acid symporter family protein [Leptospira fainei serovar Hurstbridge str. BUT 6]